MKKMILAAVAVFVAWFLLDWIIHGVFLMGIYEETKELWRPMEEVSMPLSIIVKFLVAFFFCYLFHRYVGTKSVGSGIGYGILVGLIWGISMGYGTYIYQPIPYSLAFGWFIASLVNCTAGGLLCGLIIKEEAAPAAEE